MRNGAYFRRLRPYKMCIDAYSVAQTTVNSMGFYTDFIQAMNSTISMACKRK